MYRESVVLKDERFVKLGIFHKILFMTTTLSRVIAEMKTKTKNDVGRNVGCVHQAKKFVVCFAAWNQHDG